MPVKNAAKFLDQTLDSIINQKKCEFELICVDDHSSDDSALIIRKYVDRDKRISYIKNQNSGIIPALQLGLKNAKGSYITRMDADDLMPPEKLRTLKNLLDLQNIGIVTGKVKYFSDAPLGNGFKLYETWLNNLCQNKNHYTAIYKECVLPSPAWMIRKKDLINLNLFKDLQYPEDYDFCFKLYTKQIPIYSTNKIVHLWRDHPNRTSRNDPNYADNRFIGLKIKYFKKELKENSLLILCGAGKNGKCIAKELIQHNISFIWCTDNPKKIGHKIYDTIIQPYPITNNHHAVYLIGIANKTENNYLQDHILNLGIDRRQIYSFF